MSYPVFPPEVNSALIHAGAGPGPMLAAATSWAQLADELHSAATSFESVTASLTSGPWQGPAAMKMAEAAAPYATWLTTAAAHSEAAASQAAAVATAFETVFTATVQPIVIAANRTMLGALANTNFFGLNLPAIAALETDYEEMWIRDVTAMFGYHVDASAALANLGPIQQLLSLIPGVPPTVPVPKTPSASVPAAPETPASPPPAGTPTNPPAPPPTKLPMPPPGDRIYPPGPVKIPVYG
ncbi:PPE family protein [Mycobacterium camsae]|uniref:PPE family protein n=1 Tax=Mycobacterium gordonae TaxID=1778 RepID=UPI00197FBCCF|nr:PPE family protein [Mycobacterium gordonae]